MGAGIGEHDVWEHDRTVRSIGSTAVVVTETDGRVHIQRRYDLFFLFSLPLLILLFLVSSVRSLPCRLHSS